jgi:general secretion pathway protein I
MRSKNGFTLLEVLVATAIMGIAIAGLLNAISGSARNASRLGQYDRAVLMAKSKMDELLVEPRLPRNIPMTGTFDSGATWKAVVHPYETIPGSGPGYWDVDRIELEIGWMDGPTKHSFSLEGFRRGILAKGDIPQ